MRAETGLPLPLPALVEGNWVYPGGLVERDTTVEIQPPIAGG